MKKVVFWSVIILMGIILMTVQIAFAKNSFLNNMAFKLTPSGGLPLGSSTESFKFGGGAGLEARYFFPKKPGIFLSGAIGYGLFPIKASDSISVINFGAGGVVYSSLLVQSYTWRVFQTRAVITVP